MAGPPPKQHFIHVLDERILSDPKHLSCIKVDDPGPEKRTQYMGNSIVAKYADHLPHGNYTMEYDKHFYDRDTKEYYDCDNSPYVFQQRKGLVFEKAGPVGAQKQTDANKKRIGQLANRTFSNTCSRDVEYPDFIVAPPVPEDVRPLNGRPGIPLYYVSRNRTDGYGDIVLPDKTRCTPEFAICDTRVWELKTAVGSAAPSKPDYRRTRDIEFDGVQYTNCYDPIVGTKLAFDNVIGAGDTVLTVSHKGSMHLNLIVKSRQTQKIPLELTFFKDGVQIFIFQIKPDSRKKLELVATGNVESGVLRGELANLMRQYFRLNDGVHHYQIDYDADEGDDEYTWISWEPINLRQKTQRQAKADIARKLEKKRKRSSSESSKSSKRRSLSPRTKNQIDLLQKNTDALKTTLRQVIENAAEASAATRRAAYNTSAAAAAAAFTPDDQKTYAFPADIKEMITKLSKGIHEHENEIRRLQGLSPLKTGKVFADDTRAKERAEAAARAEAADAALLIEEAERRKREALGRRKRADEQAKAREAVSRDAMLGIGRSRSSSSSSSKPRKPRKRSPERSPKAKKRTRICECAGAGCNCQLNRQKQEELKRIALEAYNRDRDVRPAWERPPSKCPFCNTTTCNCYGR